MPRRLMSGKKKMRRGGAILIGNLPHGFYEREIEGYFSQYGDIVNIRVARSNKVS